MSSKNGQNPLRLLTSKHNINASSSSSLWTSQRTHPQRRWPDCTQWLFEIKFVLVGHWAWMKAKRRGENGRLLSKQLLTLKIFNAVIYEQKVFNYYFLICFSFVRILKRLSLAGLTWSCRLHLNYVSFFKQVTNKIIIRHVRCNKYSIDGANWAESKFKWKRVEYTYQIKMYFKRNWWVALRDIHQHCNRFSVQYQVLSGNKFRQAGISLACRSIISRR